MSKTNTSFLLRVYRRLLSFYPIHYAQKYAEDMTLTFADVLTDVEAEQGKIGMWIVSFISLFDTLGQVLRENFIYLTHRGDYMTEPQPINQVRGFRSFFWSLVATYLILLALPVYQYDSLAFLQLLLGYAVWVLLGVFFLVIGFLLVRSKRQWSTALFIGVFGFIAGALLSDMSSYLWSGLSVSGIIRNTLDGHGWLEGYINSLFFFGGFFIVGYLLVKEVERPHISLWWQKVIKAQTPGADTRAWRFLIKSMLLGLVLFTVNFVLYNKYLLGNIPQSSLGEAFNNLSGLPIFFFQMSKEGLLILITAVVLVALTAGCSWIFTGRNLLRTSVITGGFILLGLAGYYAGIKLAIPHDVVLGGSSGVATLSNKQGYALAESCAVNDAAYFGQTVEAARTMRNLQGPAPVGVTKDLCIKYTTPRREGNIFYTGGYGSSSDSHTGELSDFVLSGEILPPLGLISDSPRFLLTSVWFIIFILPVCLTLGLANLLRKKA